MKLNGALIYMTPKKKFFFSLYRHPRGFSDIHNHNSSLHSLVDLNCLLLIVNFHDICFSDIG